MEGQGQGAEAPLLGAPSLPSQSGALQPAPAQAQAQALFPGQAWVRGCLLPQLEGQDTHEAAVPRQVTPRCLLLPSIRGFPPSALPHLRGPLDGLPHGGHSCCVPACGLPAMLLPMFLPSSPSLGLVGPVGTRRRGLPLCAQLPPTVGLLGNPAGHLCSMVSYSAAESTFLIHGSE